MKIESLFCPCNGRSDNPPDHYNSKSCTKLPAPLPWILSCIRDLEGDTAHADLNITTTRLTGSCAREIAIIDSFPIPGFDIRRANSTHWGTILHRDLQSNALPGDYAEVLIPPEGRPAPIVLGLPLTGKLDCVNADLSKISDYKGHSEFKQKSLLNKAIEPEVRAQLSIYGFMVQRAFDLPFPELTVWHGAMVSAGGTPWFEQHVAPMSEEEILQMRSFSGHYSVADRIEEYKQLKADVAAGVPIEDAIRKMKLMGRTMFNGQKCLKYCYAKDICDRLEGIGGI